MFDLYAYIASRAQQLGWPQIYRITGMQGMEELVANVRNTQYPCVAVETGADGSIDLSQGSCTVSYCTFYVLDQLDDPNDMARLEEVMAQSFAIGRSILLQMCKECDDLSAAAYGFQRDQINYSRITSAGMGAVGYSYNILIKKDYE